MRAGVRLDRRAEEDHSEAVPSSIRSGVFLLAAFHLQSSTTSGPAHSSVPATNRFTPTVNYLPTCWIYIIIYPQLLLVFSQHPPDCFFSSLPQIRSILYCLHNLRLSEVRSELIRNLALKEGHLLAKATELENIRREEEHVHQVNLSRLGGSPRMPFSATTPPLLSPGAPHSASVRGLMTEVTPATGTVLVPVGKDVPLPEPAMLVLRGLWARLGYQGRAFVEMQVEVSKELARADFARFEREMLCNEIMSLRQELDVIRDDRNEHIRRAEAVQVNLTQVMDAEERTFKALVAERELAKRAIERAERGVAQVSAAREKEAVRAEAMGEEVRRLEKERVAAVLYARTAEEQATLANMTAKTAAAVALSAVHTQPPTPRVGFAPTPAPPSRPITPGRHAPATPRATPRLTPAPSPGPSRAGGLHNWEDIDSAIMQTKIRERRIEAEENRLAAEATRLAQDRIRLRAEKERIGTPVSGSGSISGNSHHHHHDHHHQTGWSHQGGH